MIVTTPSAIESHIMAIDECGPLDRKQPDCLTESRGGSDPSTRRQGGYYRPELDMVRLLAFLSVFLTHGVSVNLKTGFFHKLPLLGATVGYVARIGGDGLPLFFFLSAFLITTLLIFEKERTGEVHLRKFYVRRILRIWPLYLGFLLVAFVLGFAWGPLRFNTSTLLAFLLVCSNWYLIAFGVPAISIRFLWSIAVEEQFYLIWPALIRKFGIRGMRNLCVAIFFTGIFCIGILASLGSLSLNIWFNTLSQMIFLAGGALLALRIGKQEQKKNALRALAGIIGGIALWLSAEYASGAPLSMIPITPLRAVSFYLLVCMGCATILIGFMHMPKTWVRPELVYLGRISYGLYVFQGIGLAIGENVISRYMHGGSWLLVSLAISIALAIPSYEFYEKPFLKLKRRFEFVHSRPVADSAMAPEIPSEITGMPPERQRDAVISVPRSARIGSAGMDAPVHAPETQGPARDDRPAAEMPHQS